jgi:hypothetical protein
LWAFTYFEVMFDKKHNLLRWTLALAVKVHQVRTMLRFAIEGRQNKDLEIIELKNRYNYAICKIGTLYVLMSEFLDCTTSSPFMFIRAYIWFSPKLSIVLLYHWCRSLTPLSHTWISNWSSTSCKLSVVFSAPLCLMTLLSSSITIKYIFISNSLLYACLFIYSAWIFKVDVNLRFFSQIIKSIKQSETRQ